MSKLSDYYAGQIAACDAEAETTPLVNVRERLLRSRDAWAVLLEREEKAEVARGGRPA